MPRGVEAGEQRVQALLFELPDGRAAARCGWRCGSLGVSFGPVPLGGGLERAAGARISSDPSVQGPAQPIRRKWWGDDAEWREAAERGARSGWRTSRGRGLPGGAGRPRRLQVHRASAESRDHQAGGRRQRSRAARFSAGRASAACRRRGEPRASGLSLHTADQSLGCGVGNWPPPQSHRLLTASCPRLAFFVDRVAVQEHLDFVEPARAWFLCVDGSPSIRPGHRRQRFDRVVGGFPASRADTSGARWRHGRRRHRQTFVEGAGQAAGFVVVDAKAPASARMMRSW